MHLWMFTGSVPEDGDYALVWASDAAEAMAEGRRLRSYEGDQDGYEDEDFSVERATSTDIILWAPSLINRTIGAGGTPVEEGVLDTDEVRSFLEEQVIKALDGAT
jgi:hypothetical protein